MRTSSLLSLLFLMCNALQAQQMPRLPEIGQVIEAFLTEYNNDDIPPADAVTFEKRKDGWHIAYTLQGDTTVHRYLFYALSSASYQLLPFAGNPDRIYDENTITEYRSGINQHAYNSSPYFGYAGWAMDVIKDYKVSADASDSVLYALGRAYSTAGDEQISSFKEFGDPKRLWALQDGPNALSSEQMDWLISCWVPAVRIFQMIERRNPAFETLVGDIHNKVFAEQMSAFVNLLMYQNEQTAVLFQHIDLRKDLPYYSMRNLLVSVPDSAVIIAQGDMATYHLIYLQAMEQLRPDVVIMDYGLAQTPRYRSLLHRGTSFSRPLRTTELDTLFSNCYPHALYMQGDRVLSLTELFDQLSDTSNIYDYDETLQIKVLDGNSVEFIDGSEHLFIKPRSSRFTRTDLEILNVLKTHATKHPVCIPISTSLSVLPNIGNGMVYRGAYYMIEPFADTLEYHLTKRTDVDTWYTDFMELYAISWTAGTQHNKADTGFFETFKYLLTLDLCKELYALNRIDSMKNVLNKWDAMAGWKNHPTGPNDVNFIRYYCAISDYETALHIANDLLSQIAQTDISSKYETATIISNIEQLAKEFPASGLSEVLEHWDK